MIKRNNARLKISLTAFFVLTSLLFAGMHHQVTAKSKMSSNQSRVEPATALGASMIEPPVVNPWRQAKLRGVNFRAVGRDPLWVLEVTGDKSLELKLPESEKKETLRFGSYTTDPESRVGYIDMQERGYIQIAKKACRDTKTGDYFQKSVTVRLDGWSLLGCGLSLSNTFRF